MNLSVFPNPVRLFIEQFAHASKAPPPFVACGVLAAISSIGSAFRLKVKPGYVEHPNLYLALVGKPSAVKTPAVMSALRPLREVQSREYKSYRDALERWQAQCVGVKGSERKDLELDKPQRPLTRISNKGTMEGVLGVLEGNGKVSGSSHLICHKDELSSLWGDMNAYRGGLGSDMETYLSLFNGGDVYIHNKGSETFIEDASLTIIGGIQPQVFKGALGEQGKSNGLIERILFSIDSGQSVCSNVWDCMNEDTEYAYARYLGECISWADAVVGGNPHSGMLRLSTKAKERIQELYEKYHIIGASHHTGVFKKWEINLHKLIICCAVMHCEPEVTVECVERAGIMMDYFLEEWLKAYDITEMGEADVMAEELYNVIREKGAVNHGDLLRQKRYRNRRDVCIVALRMLEKAGRIVKEEVNTAGRKGHIYSVKEE